MGPDPKRCVEGYFSKTLKLCNDFKGELWCERDCGRTFSETSSRLSRFFFNEFERLSIAFGKATHPD
jgi:hypothetical protein